MRNSTDIEHNGRTVAEILEDEILDLRYANLRYADLRYANLRDADLRYANLWGADLRDADLRETNLRYADLRDADLRETNLRDADLRDADLWGADLPNYQIVPEIGSFTAFKATQEHIVRLEIPEDAERTSSLIGRKCRASKARVEAILDSDGNQCDATTAYSRHKGSFIYEEGETVHPDEYDDDIRVECSNGIHFFVTKQEAIDWL